MPNSPLSVGQCATLACLLEVTAPKPGNVHRGADFEDMTFTDFMLSAVAIGPAVDEATDRAVGATVLAAIQATRQLVDVNTNLGTVLLIAPLAAVPRDQCLENGLPAVLRAMTAEDAVAVYEAIRLAQPGGMGCVNEMDVGKPAPPDLLAAMRDAASRDMVARQYAEDFDQLLHVVRPQLVSGLDAGWLLSDAIIHAQMQLLARYPDSLIERKCGVETARLASELAAGVLQAGQPGQEAYHRALADMDFWMRSDANRRNPGTTADLIAAGLFALLRDGAISFDD
jgi:triphosphoribosyl-dephospho-CoA synthase